jgi:hypothetical protein
MIYARALDKTVAEDYFKAMEQVEQKLALPITCSNRSLSPTEMLALVDVLFSTDLNPEQFEIASTLHTGLVIFSGELAPEGNVNVRTYV